MDPKITILFVLIGVIIALSHLNEDRLRRFWRQFAGRGWRDFMPVRRRT